MPDRNLQLNLNISVNNRQAIQQLLADLEKLRSGGLGGISPDEVGKTNQQFSALKTKVAELEARLKELTNKVPKDGGAFGAGLSSWGAKLGLLSFGFNQVTQAVQILVATARPAYDALIASNEKLNQQILQSSASLAATSSVTANGKELDTLEAIRALQPKLKAAIKEVQVATLDLVGVTSEQTITAFNTVLKQAGQLGTQLKSIDGSGQEFRDSIDAAAKLAPGLVAALGTFQLGPDQVADEINNLVRGEIDRTAQLANQLKISRQQVEQWRAQGTLVANLKKAFDPFLIANKEAANSIGGISSNIQDVINLFNRAVGQPLLDPVIAGLRQVFDGLEENQAQLEIFGRSVVNALIPVFTTIADAFKPVIKAIVEGIGDIAPSLLENLQSASDGIVRFIEGIKPFIAGIAPLVSSGFDILRDLLPVFNEVSKAAQDAFASVVDAFSSLGPSFNELRPILTEFLSIILRLAANGLLTPLVAGLKVIGGVAQLLKPAIDTTTRVYDNLRRIVDLLTGPLKFLGKALGIDFGAETRKLKEQEKALDSLAKKSQETNRTLAKGDADRAAGRADSLKKQIDAIAKERDAAIQRGEDGTKYQDRINALQAEQQLALKAQADAREAASQQRQEAEVRLKSLEEIRKKQQETGQDTSGTDRAIEGTKRLIAETDKATKAYDAYANSVDVATKKAENLGKTNELAARELRSAEEALANAANTQEADDAAKRIQQAQETNASLGLIERDASIERLKILQDDGRLSLDQRQRISEALKKLIREQNQLELEETKTKRAEIQAAIADGTRGEADAQRELTQITVQESQLRIKALQAEAAQERDPNKRKQLLEQIKQQEAEVTKSLAEERKRQQQERLKDFDEQQTQLKASFDQGKISREDYSKQVLAIGQAQLNEEEKQLREALGRLSATDKEGREAILSQLAAIQSKRVDLVKQAYDREVQIAEDAAGKAQDAIRDKELAGQIQIAQLELAGGSREEIEKRKLQLTEQRIAAELQAEQQKLEAIKAANAANPATNPEEEAKRQNQIRDQAAAVEQLRLKQIEQRKAAEEAAVQAIVRANQKANEELQRATQARVAAAARAELDALKASGTDVQAAARRRSAAELAIKRESLDQEYALKQQQLDQILGLENQNNEEVKSQRKQLENELSQLTLSRIDLEKQALEQLRQERLRLIEIERQDANRPLERRIELLNQAKELLSQQNSLIDAQSGLQQAQFGLSQQRLQLLKEDAQARGDAFKAARLEQQIARENIANVVRENELRLVKLDIAQRQREQEAQSAIIQAQIEQINARAAIAAAEAEGKSQREIDALKQVLNLRSEQLKLTESQAVNQQRVSALERQTTLTENRSRLAAAQAEGARVRQETSKVTGPEFSGGLPKLTEVISSIADAQGPIDGLTQSAAASTAGIDQLANSSTTAAGGLEQFSQALANITNTVQSVPARRDGGPVGAGQVFQGAEAGPELVQYNDGGFGLLSKPGIYALPKSGNVIDAAKTRAMMRRPLPSGSLAGSMPIAAGGDGVEILSSIDRRLAYIAQNRPKVQQNVTVATAASQQFDEELARLSRAALRL